MRKVQTRPRVKKASSSPAAQRRGWGALLWARRLSPHMRLLLAGAVALAVLAIWQWQGIVRTAQETNRILGVGAPLALGWGTTYVYALRRWRRRALRQTHRWMGALSLGLALLALLSLLGLQGSVAVFPLQTALGAELARGPIWSSLLKLLALGLLGTALLAPRASLVAGRWAAIRGAIYGSRAARSLARGIAQGLARSVAQAPRLRATTASPEGRQEAAMEPIKAEIERQDEPDLDEEEPLPSPIPIIRGRSQPPAEEPGDGASPPASGWRLPPLDLLEPGGWEETDDSEHLEQAAIIQRTLEEYGIEAQVVEIRPGPTVTQYGVRPGWQRRYRETIERDDQGQAALDPEGRPVIRRQETSRTRVKVDRIAALDKDLALALEALIRIEAPVPSTGIVGIEVPNHSPRQVSLRSVIESAPFRKMTSETKLVIPVGIGTGGDSVVGDLTQMPHLLIAGATGSGKSVFITSLLSSILLHTTPEEVRLLLVDPKRVELTRFEDIPHLITPVLLDPEAVVNALKWTLAQMEERLKLLAEAGAREIRSYNVDREEKLPYLLLVIDELADLMMTSGKSVEHGLCRLAQMGRATGIHLIIATQRPSVDVVTGLIKANFPSRISFSVSSSVDSRTVLDMGGAEKLLGRGDLFYAPQDSSRPVRVQGAFVTDEEVRRTVDFWRAQSGSYKPSPLPDMSTVEEGPGYQRTGHARKEPLLEDARELAQFSGGRVSTSLLQRRLGIGYPRAARLKDLLAEEGLVTSEEPPSAREISAPGQGRKR